MELKPGNLCFAKIKGYSPWPARINPLPSDVKIEKGKIPVFFYGTHQISHVHQKDVFICNDDNMNKYSKSKNKKLLEALDEMNGNPTIFQFGIDPDAIEYLLQFYKFKINKENINKEKEKKQKIEKRPPSPINIVTPTEIPRKSARRSRRIANDDSESKIENNGIEHPEICDVDLNDIPLDRNINLDELRSSNDTSYIEPQNKEILIKLTDFKVDVSNQKIFDNEETSINEDNNVMIENSTSSKDNGLKTANAKRIDNQQVKTEILKDIQVSSVTKKEENVELTKTMPEQEKKIIENPSKRPIRKSAQKFNNTLASLTATLTNSLNDYDDENSKKIVKKSHNTQKASNVKSPNDINQSNETDKKNVKLPSPNPQSSLLKEKEKEKNKSVNDKRDRITTETLDYDDSHDDTDPTNDIEPQDDSNDNKKTVPYSLNRPVLNDSAILFPDDSNAPCAQLKLQLMKLRNAQLKKNSQSVSSMDSSNNNKVRPRMSNFAKTNSPTTTLSSVLDSSPDKERVMRSKLSIIDHEIKCSLVVGRENMTRCLQLMETLKNELNKWSNKELSPLCALCYVSDIVYTIRKCRRYKNDTRVRVGAHQIYDKFRDIFTSASLNQKFDAGNILLAKHNDEGDAASLLSQLLPDLSRVGGVSGPEDPPSMTPLTTLKMNQISSFMPNASIEPQIISSDITNQSPIGSSNHDATTNKPVLDPEETDINPLLKNGKLMVVDSYEDEDASIQCIDNAINVEKPIDLIILTESD